jgi:ectoine hydroxylase-related dioxygenase (phytanoyl-CoA dioxygenase family)
MTDTETAQQVQPGARGPRLAPAQVDSYRRDGYLLVHEPIFEPAELDQLVSIYEEHVGAEPDKRADEFDTPHFKDRRLLAFLLDERVLDLVECLIGPRIILWSSHFIGKEPVVGRATPWHRDSDYWEGRLDRFDQIVTVWLALDDVDRENGCMQVLAGSHLAEEKAAYRAVAKESNTFGREIADLDESTAVAFELRRGECSLHDGRIAHGARANTSGRRRLGYTMRYLSADTTILPGRPEHRTWVARDRRAVPPRPAS